MCLSTMDSRPLLDYALFHLTPTRTRCDLVVFSGGKSEKLASGLVEPFIAHLKYAKDQISKGGYSITLCPPTADAFWFTKDTFQRFVRFVSTPEILERFTRTEREILQIERSLHSNEVSSTSNAGCEEEGCSLAVVDGVSKKQTNSYKSICKVEGADGVASEENSKFHLQRVLDTRKSLLMKEQAMAYARAKAAGFNMEHMDDLIYFADAFGAARLREACIDFRDLYKLKCKDAQWMDEVAAMEACSPNVLAYMGASGIILASDLNGSSQSNNNQDVQTSGGSLASNGSLDDLSNLGANQTTTSDEGVSASDQTVPRAAQVQLNMPWPTQVPQYMYNFQTPIQQIPPYQGYPFPGMHPVLPYYPGHGRWPEAHKSSKKDKFRSEKGPITSEDDEQSGSSSSNSGTGTDENLKHDKKHYPSEKPHVRKKKKSSKTVVIRSINYITSKRSTGEMDNESDGSSSEETAALDEDAIKQDVVDAVTSLEKHQHSKSNKKKSGNRGSRIQNGSNACADHGLIKDLTADISEEGQKNENWNVFQSLLMNHEESLTSALQEKQSLDVDSQLAVKSCHDDISFTTASAVGLEFEKVKVHHATTDASVVVTTRDGCEEGRINMVDISNVEERRSSMKRTDCEDVELVLSRKSEDSGSSPWGMISDSSAVSSLIRNGDREDWFIVDRSENFEIQEAKQIILDESSNSTSEKDQIHMEASKGASVDDSFMVQSRTTADAQYDSEWRTDISIMSDLIMAPPPETCSPNVSQTKLGVCRSQEPDDLYVVLVRDSIIESSGSWTPEVDYGIEISYTEAAGKSSVEADTKETENVDCKSTNGKKADMKSSGKETKSRLSQGNVVKSTTNGSSKGKKLPSTSRLMSQKSKLEKEEDVRKRMEELAIERQKRIAERTAASGAASKKVVGGNKAASSKLDKHKPQLVMQGTKRLSFPKPVSMKS